MAQTGKDYFSEATLPRHIQVELLQLSKMNGYKALLDIMEHCCVLAETAHLQMDPKKVQPELICGSHAETRGLRLLFERVQAKIALETKSLLETSMSEDPDGPESPVESVLDPTK